MKKLLVLAILAATYAAAAAAQTGAETTTKDYTVGQLPGCYNDTIIVTGSYTLSFTQWVDGGGNTHSHSQLVSSDLSASTDLDWYTYKMIFSSKQIDNVTEGLPGEETFIFRLKLLGDGPLNNVTLFDEVHWTNPHGAEDGGNNTTHVMIKCTG